MAQSKRTPSEIEMHKQAAAAPYPKYDMAGPAPAASSTVADQQHFLLLAHQPRAEPFVPVKNHLGEGPHYESPTSILRWVDIICKKFHTAHIEDGPKSHNVVQFEDPISVTVDIEGTDDEYIVGAKRGFAIINKKTGDFKYIKKFWSDLAKEERAARCPLVSNGQTGSPDDKTMYFTDSPTRGIFAYDFDPETGSMSNKRFFWKLTDEAGSILDGLTVDSEGYLWIAIHEGSRVIRVSPDGQEEPDHHEGMEDNLPRLWRA
ncbi:SMP-30/Gluconolaconase/LRE-like region-domain-containing protein [Tirmania nivea]|nr:SMP-30/Gluconolaconase/LRE-like region-domain-containing protein [Tirmania nivea]